MKLLLDSSAIIFAFEYPHCNSRIIFDLVAAKKLEGVISEKAIEESKRMFALNKKEGFLYLLELDLRRNFQVIPVKAVQKEMQKWRGKIKEKDLEHLATAKALKLPYLVAFDRDFEPFPEYHAPKKFVEVILKMKAFETDY